MHYDDDYVLCECELEPLAALVTQLEQTHAVTILKEPAVCLTMIRTEDSLEKQQFYLGEALTTECEVAVNGVPGYGRCAATRSQLSTPYSIAAQVRKSTAFSTNIAPASPSASSANST